MCGLDHVLIMTAVGQRMDLLLCYFAWQKWVNMTCDTVMYIFHISFHMTEPPDNINSN